MTAIEKTSTIMEPPEPTRYSFCGHLLELYGPTMRCADVAEVLHCHQTHVRALAQKGELPGVHVGKRWVFPTAKLAALLEGGDA